MAKSKEIDEKDTAGTAASSPPPPPPIGEPPEASSTDDETKARIEKLKAEKEKADAETGAPKAPEAPASPEAPKAPTPPDPPAKAEAARAKKVERKLLKLRNTTNSQTFKINYSLFDAKDSRQKPKVVTATLPPGETVEVDPLIARDMYLNDLRRQGLVVVVN